MIADTAMDACDKARMMPGVKHDQMVIACKEIPMSVYYALRKQSAYERCLKI